MPNDPTPPNMADPAFFDELNRRFEQATQLARQKQFTEAHARFYSCLEHAAEEQVVAPISLILDVWSRMAFCHIDLNEPDRASVYYDAIESLLTEWSELNHQQTLPSQYRSFARVKPLIPDTLTFMIPDNFDSAPWLKRIQQYRQQLSPALKTVEEVMKALWDFAALHCGEPLAPPESNWYVVKDTLTMFRKTGDVEHHVGGMLFLSRSPTFAIGAALIPEGIWATLMIEIQLPENAGKGLQPVIEQTFQADKRALTAFLERFITTGILVVDGNRFRLRLPSTKS